MAYWWVNQNQTYRAEVRGNFMWSPKANANGARNPFYETMKLVAPGDIVFSFCDTRIKAIGIATGTAQTAPKPDFGSAGFNWSEEGWFVPVYYCVLDSPIRPKDHIDVLRPFLPDKYSPLQSMGNGQQGVYLARVPESLANALQALIGQDYYDAVAAISDFPSTPDPEEDDGVTSGGDFGPTFRDQVVRARRGQGVFRSSVLLAESACRVTGVSDPKHLKASHIKPWRAASDHERLNGKNGLLLSPHVDHLFDQGYITFSDDRLIVVPEARLNLLDRWGIDPAVRVGTFDREQRAFLDFHKANVFLDK